MARPMIPPPTIARSTSRRPIDPVGPRIPGTLPGTWPRTVPETLAALPIRLAVSFVRVPAGKQSQLGGGKRRAARERLHAFRWLTRDLGEGGRDQPETLLALTRT